jgi:hypothetical protein
MSRTLNIEDPDDPLDMEDAVVPDESDEPDVSDLDEETDFGDLDELLAEATKQTTEERRLKDARRRLSRVVKSGHEASQGEQLELLAEIRRLEEGRVWLTTEAVALFRRQFCVSCGNSHTYAMGWMTGQKHASDPNARRLLAGKPVEKLPERSEIHDEGMTEFCIDCVECIMAINRATGEAESI